MVRVGLTLTPVVPMVSTATPCVQADATTIDLVEPVTLTFGLKFLNSFIKATPLSPTVKLRLEKVWMHSNSGSETNTRASLLAPTPGAHGLPGLCRTHSLHCTASQFGW